MRFNEFNFKKELLRGIGVAKFYRPSPIQEKVIPIIQNGYDLIAEAETGTGKTAGFGLPIIDKIAKDEMERALVITATRELAIQISDELFFLGRFWLGIKETLKAYFGWEVRLIGKGPGIRFLLIRKGC